MSAANQDQVDAWNGDSGLRWVTDADRRDRVLQPVADALLDTARLQHGETVLDIGCGCGITTLAAADAVTPGATTGVDISSPMLEVARQRAASRTDIRFVQADAQTHQFSPTQFDVVISRFGTMFFDDPVGAFANMATATRRSGRLCIATWQPLAANDWLTVPGAVLLQYGSLPEMGDAGPGMFAQSDPGVVADVLHTAGWRDVNIAAITLTLPLGDDPEEAAQYLADAGPGRAVLETIAEPDRPRAIAAVIDALADHHGDDGVQLGAGIYLITASVEG